MWKDGEPGQESARALARVCERTLDRDTCFAYPVYSVCSYMYPTYPGGVLPAKKKSKEKEEVVKKEKNDEDEPPAVERKSTRR